MTFEELCKGTTLDERRQLAEHLAMIRMRETLKLAVPPASRPTKISEQT